MVNAKDPPVVPRVFDMLPCSPPSLPLPLPPATATDIYRVYRTYTASFRSRPVVRDILIDTQLRNPHAPTAANRHQLAAATGVGIVTGPGSHASKAAPPPPPPAGSCSAMVWLDQHVTPKLVPLPYVEAIVPTIVLLKFRPCPETGRPLVYEQYDHVSLYAFTWSFGPLTRLLFDRVMAPTVMYGMGVQAYCLDVLEETWRFVRQQVLGEPYGAGAGQGGEGGTCGGGEACSSSSSSSCPVGAGGGSGAGCGLPRGVKATPGAPGGGLEVTSGRKLRDDLPGEVDHSKTGGWGGGEQGSCCQQTRMRSCWPEHFPWTETGRVHWSQTWSVMEIVFVFVYDHLDHVWEYASSHPGRGLHAPRQQCGRRAALRMLLQVGAHPLHMPQRADKYSTSTNVRTSTSPRCGCLGAAALDLARRLWLGGTGAGAGGRQDLMRSGDDGVQSRQCSRGPCRVMPLGGYIRGGGCGGCKQCVSYGLLRGQSVGCVEG